MRVTLDLSEATWHILSECAFLERRSVRDQAVYLLERALRREAARLRADRTRLYQLPGPRVLQPTGTWKD